MNHTSHPLEIAIIRHPAVVPPDANVQDAIVQMAGDANHEMTGVARNCPPNDTPGSGSVVIVNREQGVVGLLTERDIVRLTVQQLPWRQLTVQQVIKTVPFTVRESGLTDIDSVLRLFDQHQLSHLPILDDADQLSGIISRESLQQALTSMRFPSITPDVAVSTDSASSLQAESSFYDDGRSYASLLNVLPVGIVHADLEGICTYASERYGEIFGLASQSLVGQPWSVGYSPELIEHFKTAYEQSRFENGPLTLDCQVTRADGSPVWISGQWAVAYDAAGREIGFVGTVADISDRKRVEWFLEEQYQVLERIAKAEPLKTIFPALLKAMEKYLPETVCSIMFCEDGQLCNAYAPSLPPAYVEAVNATPFPVAEGACNCGTAAYRREIVVVTDIATDPIWQDYKHLALPHGVKACLSIPIFGTHQDVLGVFGIYFRENRAPQPQEIECASKLANLAGIAIERDQVAQALKQLTQDLEKRVEERTAALQSSEQRWQLALKGAKDGIWDWNLKTNQLFLSQRLKEIRGFNAANLPDSIDDCLKLIHPEERDQVGQAIEDHLAGKSEFFEMEYRVKHGPGVYIWILSRAQAQRDHLGRAVRMIGSQTDITQRKTAEQELILKQNHLEALLNNLPHITWIKDEQSRFIAVNQPFAQVGGTTAEALVGKTDFDIWPADLAQAYRADDFQVLQSGQRKVVEEKVARADGTMGWLETTKTPFRDANGKFAGTVGIAADITDRKQIEAALADSEAKYRRLVEGGQDVIWSTDVQGRFSYLSPQFKTLTGWESSEWIGRSCVETVHPDDQAWLAASFQALADDVIAGTLEFRLSRRDQSYCWVSVSSTPVLNTMGEVVGQQGTGTDITERKAAELALQDSQDHLRRLTENIPGMIFRYVLHPDGSNEFTYVSPYARELYEMDPEEILRHEKNPWDIVHPDDVNFLASTIQQSAETLQPLRVEHRFIVPKRGLRWGQNIARPQRQDNGDVVWDGVSFDITDRKTAELALQASEDKFQRITESVPGMIFRYVLHPDGRDEMTYVSAQIRQLYELEPDAALQNIQLVWDRIHPDDVLRVSGAVEVSAASLQPFYVEIRLLFPQDRIKWVRILSRPKRYGNGDVVWDGVIVDISDRKQVEEKLKAVSDRLNLALESAEIGVWEWNGEGNTLIWDDRMFSLYGVTPQAFSGRYEDWLQLLHPDDVSRIKKQEEMALRERESITTEFRIVRSDGEVRFMASNVATLRTEKGEVVGTIGLDMDITERKQAEIALEKEVLRRSTIFNTSPDGIHVLDRAGNLLEANEGFAKMLGYRLEDVSQLNVVDWDAQGSDAVLQGKYVVDSLLCSTFETLYRRQDDFVFPVEISVCAMDWNDEVALVCIARNISERKQAEADLKRTNQELARATRLKDEFLANMSHELRTPLNAILGMTEGLQDEVFGPINKQQIQALETTEQSGLHLLELINEILDLAKIESGNMALVYAPVAVTHLCQSSLTFVKQQSLEKNIQLHLNVPWDLPDIRVDERRIRQVLINLLNNAVKFTPSGGNVTLTIVRATLSDTQQHPYLRFSVTDTGIGIAPDELNHLFQPFVQIDSALNRQYEGTGLGLALVKRVVELHGGRVGVSSEVGVGSCFSIELPYEPVGQPSAGQPSAVSEVTSTARPLPSTLAHSIESPLVLWVKAQATNRDPLSRYLQAQGYRIQVAQTAPAAIALTQVEVPQIILMDLPIPGMDGVSAIEHIRQLPNLASTPIIALTAFSMDHDRDCCLTAGANQWLGKPIKFNQLALSIQALLA